MSGSAIPIARQLWQQLETLHAVTYFGERSHAAAREAGLKGFWMGYFGFRAAPLGAVEPAVVDATFANFAPRMVERSVPDVWTFASPAQLIIARRRAAADELRAAVPDIDSVADRSNERLASVVRAGRSLGRPLSAANAALDPVDDPVAQLWQHATTLREHRGDGHVATLVAAGIDGCEAHLLHAAEHRTPHEVLQSNRGWTDGEWEAARERLVERGLLAGDALTKGGRVLRREIEAETDRLAAMPFDRSLESGEQLALVEMLAASARAVAASGIIPFPNPMGLPAPA